MFVRDGEPSRFLRLRDSGPRCPQQIDQGYLSCPRHSQYCLLSIFLALGYLWAIVCDCGSHFSPDPVFNPG